MKLLYKLLGIKVFEKNKLSFNSFGITLLCFLASILYFVFAFLFYNASLHMLGYLCAIEVPITFLLFLYCRKDSPRAYQIAYLILVAGVLLLHLLMTYYMGNAGSIFLIVAALLPNHIFNIFSKKTQIILFDLFLILAVNIIFWVEVNFAPALSTVVNPMFSAITLNACLGICIFELFVHIFVKIAAEKEQRKEFEQTSNKAFNDALTGLGNRHMLFKMQEELENSISERKPFCIAMLDIDMFKAVNDTYGHAVGDQVLKTIAATMRSMFRKDDILIRWGDEELLIILQNTKLDQAKILLDRFFNGSNPISLTLENGETIHITVTIGVCEHDPNISLKQSIELADRLMYRGKMEGRNRLVAPSGDDK